MQSLFATIRIVMATMLICVVGYAATIWAVGEIFTPDTAQGSLIVGEDGKIIGSRLIAQNFTRPDYFWPRPSAAGKEGYDAASAAGSNKSPTSSDLTDRARELIARYGASEEKPLPAELAAASGGGLDPHISVGGALYQADRVAKARGLEQSQIEELIQRHSSSPGKFLTPDRLVNVLELNLALDKAFPARQRVETKEEASAASATPSPLVAGAPPPLTEAVPSPGPAVETPQAPLAEDAPSAADASPLPLVEAAPEESAVAPPSVTPPEQPSSRPQPESAGAEAAVFPARISPAYAGDKPDKARVKTCSDQYRANVATSSNGGLTRKAYLKECEKRLKG